MKTWSPDWKASRQPRKQRKYRFEAPLQVKRRFTNALLSKELRKKHGSRNLGLHSGDTVKVMRGQFKNRQGKVESISLKDAKIIISGIMLQKKDGTKVPVLFEPSKVQIIELKLDDKKRQAILERRK